MTSFTSKEYFGSLYAILSGFLYGFVGYFGVSTIHASMSITSMLFWRFCIASIVIGMLVIGWNRRTKMSLKDLGLAFLNGAIFYSFSTMLYFLSSSYIGSGLAMVIFFTFPAMVILLNYFLWGEAIASIYYLALFVILIGMLCFIDKNAMRIDLVGVLLSLTSALFYAVYIIFSKKITRLLPSVATLMICLGCMTSNFFFSLASHTLTVPSTLSVWGNLIGIGVLSTAAPILLLLYSLNYISAGKASILSVLEPVFVLIFGIMLLGEPMKLRYLFGVVIVLTGVSFILWITRSNLIDAE